jgi:hypothetical protein
MRPRASDGRPVSRIGSVQTERRPALAHAVMVSLISWSFSNWMFRYFLVDHAVPAMWRSLAAARTLITERPPHRSERAQLRHSAPTLDV